MSLKCKMQCFYTYQVNLFQLIQATKTCDTISQNYSTQEKNSNNWT